MGSGTRLILLNRIDMNLLLPKVEKMTSGWRTTTLGNICDSDGAVIQTGPFGAQLHSYDYQPTGTPVVPTEAIGQRRINPEGLPRVTAEKAEELKRHRLRAGDILFARRGVQATGSSAMIRPEQAGWLCGTGAILLRVKTPAICPQFLSFAVSAPAAIAWLKSHAVGAVMPNLNESVLRRLPLTLPPLPEQQAIAEILGCLDDKIDLNRRMNETLEALARAVFQSWFVDFDPVRTKAEGRQPEGLDAATAALFPDRFEDSPLGAVPKGWRVSKLGVIATNPRRGATASEIAPGTAYVALEHMPRRCISIIDWETQPDVESNKFCFHRGEILFGKLRPYFHKVGVAPIDGICSTDILVIAPKSANWFGFALCHYSSNELVRHADATSTGTKMPRTSWPDLSSFEVVLPDEQIARKFDAVVRLLVDKIITNIHESRTLALTRDALLPKLLSGQVRIADAERLIGGVV